MKPTTKVDVWSLVCTLVELFTGKDCWGQLEDSDVEKEDDEHEDESVPPGCGAIYHCLKAKEHPKALQQFSPETVRVKDILVKCFDYNASERPDAINILKYL
jgi:serine/threonine protein kinase